MSSEIEARIIDNQMVILSVLERLLTISPEMTIKISDGLNEYDFTKEDHQVAIRNALTRSVVYLPPITIEESGANSDQ